MSGTLLPTQADSPIHLHVARVSYFKQMQEFSDSVAELDAKHVTPFALSKAIAELKSSETEHERAVVGQISRRRFIDQKLNVGSGADANDDETCLICSDTETGHRVVTRCVHLFHLECLNKWFEARFSRTCPVCRSSLEGTKAVTKLSDGKTAPVTAAGINSKSAIAQLPCASAAGPSSASTRASLPEQDMEVDETHEQIQGIEDKFNYLSHEEVELINDVPLGGAALGSKLDMITKHVLHLRDKHQRAMEAFHASDHDGMTEVESPAEAKILIYSGWQYACDVLAQALNRERIGYVRLETPGKGRKESAVMDFKENPDIAVFILHAQSQAAGLVGTTSLYMHRMMTIRVAELDRSTVCDACRTASTTCARTASHCPSTSYRTGAEYDCLPIRGQRHRRRTNRVTLA